MAVVPQKTPKSDPSGPGVESLEPAERLHRRSATKFFGLDPVSSDRVHHFVELLDHHCALDVARSREQAGGLGLLSRHAIRIAVAIGAHNDPLNDAFHDARIRRGSQMNFVGFEKPGELAFHFLDHSQRVIAVANMEVSKPRIEFGNYLRRPQAVAGKLKSADEPTQQALLVRRILEFRNHPPADGLPQGLRVGDGHEPRGLQASGQIDEHMAEK